MPSSDEDLVLLVTLRKSTGYRLRVFKGFPLDVVTAKPLEGFEDVAFSLHEWQQEESPTIKALKSLVVGRPRVRFCYDPSEPYLNLLPLEDLFASRLGVPLSRHPLTKTGKMATAYAEDVSVLGKLKVLIIYANPDPRRFGKGDPEHLPHLREHFRVLVQALGGLVPQQLVVFEVLDNEKGGLAAQHVIERIQTFNPHIVVYAGHGYYDPIYDRSGLYWGDRDEERLPFGLLRATLTEMGKRPGEDKKPSLRLLVLIACYSAKAGPQLLAGQAQDTTSVWSEGQGVPEVQVPVVIGMYDKFPSAAVAAFSEPFFRAVSQRQSIEEAFLVALRASGESSDPVIQQANFRSRLWLTASHSHLFPQSEDCARGLYLEKVKGQFGHVSLANRITTVPLEDLYVDRVVIERKEDVQQRSRPQESLPSAAEQLGHLGRHAMEPPEPDKVVELQTALDSRHRVLLVGEAGIGKSTLCQHVVTGGDQQIRWLPILLRFSEFARSGKGLRKFLQEDHVGFLGLDKLTVLSGTGEAAQEVPFGEWLYLQWEAGEALLIVDGLDEEFNEEQRATALEHISLIADKQKQTRVLFTSRPFGTMLVKDAYVLHLKEFDKEDQLGCCVQNCEQVLAQLEGREANKQRVNDFLKVLDEDHRRKDLARRPGHLVGMYVQFCDTGLVSPFADDLMEWIARGRFTVIGKGRADPPLELNEPTDRRLIMNEVGFHLLFCRRTLALPREEILALIGRAKRSTQFAGIAQTHILNDLVRNSGFLREVQVEGKEGYEVEGARWLQFFAACYLAGLRDKAKRNQELCRWLFDQGGFTCELCHKNLPPFNHYFWHADGRDTVTLLAGLLEDATPLLKCLQVEPDDVFHQMLTLAAHCLGSSKKAKQEVAGEITEAVCQTWRRALEQGPSFGTVELGALSKGRQEKWAEQVWTFLSTRLKDEDRNVRWVAATALGEIKDARAVLGLVEALKDEDLFIRRAAAEALGKLNDPRVVPALVKALKNEYVSAHAAEALVKIGDPEAMRPLLSAARCWQQEDLWQAVQTLSQKARIRVYKNGKWEPLSSIEPSSV